MSATFSILPERGLLLIEGEDRISFLQGLISNDVSKVTQGTGIYSAFLTPQGKFLCDFFIAQRGQSLLVDMQADALPSFKKKLTMYKLRADVKIADVSEDYAVIASVGGTLGLDDTNGPVFPDPRLGEAGERAIITKDALASAVAELEEVPFETYDLHRIKLGLPDGARDMEVEKSILLENGFDELNGVDWNKGCYMGQELTARTKYRALIKKRLFPVEVEGDLPEPGTEIKDGDKTVGTIHSGQDKHALATVKLIAKEAELVAGNAKIRLHQPDWMVIPEPKD